MFYIHSERGQVDLSDGMADVLLRSPNFQRPNAVFFSRFHPSSVRLLIMNSFTEGGGAQSQSKGQDLLFRFGAKSGVPKHILYVVSYL